MQGYRKARLVVLGGVLGGWLGGQGLVQGYEVVVNEPFAAVADGPLGVTVVDVDHPDDPAEVARRIAQATASLPTRAAPGPELWWFEELKRRGVLPPNAVPPCFPRTLVLRHRGRLLGPGWERQALPYGAADNELTFTYEGWSADQQAQLQPQVEALYANLRRLYGPPAVARPIKIIHDNKLRVLESATYNLSTGELRLKLLWDNDPAYLDTPQQTPFDRDGWDFYVVALMLARAFHDAALLSFDAWEEGLARAAQLIVIRQVLPGFDIFRDPMYVATGYATLNQPALGNATFSAGDTTDLLRQSVRVGMAQAAWMKVYVAHPGFFRDFHARYYERLNRGERSLAGDVPRLKNLCREVVPMVEGLDFLDWYRRQSILDTSITVGPKLFVFNVPTKTYNDRFDQFDNALILIIHHYRTTVGGQEEPLTGTAALRYLAFDGYDLTSSAIGGETGVADHVVLGNFGDPGIGFITPLFYNIGGPQRIRVQVQVNGLLEEVFYPFDVARGDAPPPNDLPNTLFGLITNGIGGKMKVEIEGKEPLDLTVTQGVFSAQVPGGLAVPARALFTFSQGSTEVQRAFHLPLEQAIVIFPLAEVSSQFTHLFPAGRQMISLPAWPAASDEAEVLGIPRDQLLLARHRPEQVGNFLYQLYPETPPFRPGLGYWLDLPTERQVEFVGEPGTPNVVVEKTGGGQEAFYQLPLAVGWQQIGNPYPDFALSVEDIQVQRGSEARVSMAQARINGWVGYSVWGYTGQGYASTSRLEPWRGYWLQVLPEAEGGVTLFFPEKAAQASRQGPTGIGKPGTWQVNLVAQAGAALDSENFFGVSPEASRSYDRGYDEAQPPDYRDYVSLSFPHPEWGRQAGDYARDIRASGSPREVWEAVVRTDLPNTEVTVTWPNLREVPPDIALTLIDPAAGACQSLRSTSCYRFRSGPTGATRPLTLIAERRPAGGLAITSLNVTPGRGGGVLTYTLSGPATVEINLRSLTGRRVGSLGRGRAAAPGVQTYTWEAVDEAGRPLPNGAYLVEVIATAEDGQQARAVRQITVFR
jgi:hypothetical protein